MSILSRRFAQGLGLIIVIGFCAPTVVFAESGRSVGTKSRMKRGAKLKKTKRARRVRTRKAHRRALKKKRMPRRRITPRLRTVKPSEFVKRVCRMLDRRCKPSRVMKQALGTLIFRMGAPKKEKLSRLTRRQLPSRFAKVLKRSLSAFRASVSKQFKRPVSRRHAVTLFAYLTSLEIDPYGMLVNETAHRLCKGARCRKEAKKALRSSSLVRSQIGLKPKGRFATAFNRFAYQNRHRIHKVVRTSAWVAIVDRDFRAAIGLGGANQYSHDQLRKAALMMAGGAGQKVMNVAKPNCEERASEMAPVTGGCGLPNSPMGPGGGAGPDPSPIAFARVGAPGGAGRVGGRLSPRQMQVPSWMMPGACYGLDPSKIFNTAGNPGDDGQTGNDDTGKEGQTAISRNEDGKGRQGKDRRRQGKEQPRQAERTSISTETRSLTSKNELQLVSDALVHLNEQAKSLLSVEMGPLTFDGYSSMKDSFNTMGDGALKGEFTPQVTLKFTFLPTPDGDMSNVCSQSFASGMAGCIPAPAQQSGGGHLLCGDTIAPISMPSGPSPAFCQCMKGGGSGGKANSGGGNSTQSGGGDCCPGFCMVAAQKGMDTSGQLACQGCKTGPDCGGGSHGGGGQSLVEACLGGKLGEPIHSALCGAIDPSPMMKLIRSGKMVKKLRLLKRMQRKGIKIRRSNRYRPGEGRPGKHRRRGKPNP